MRSKRAPSRNTGEEETGKKIVQISMNPVFWEVLYLLTESLSIEKNERVALGGAVGAILSHFFLAHYEEILAQSVNTKHEEVVRQLRTVLRSGEFEELTTTGVLPLPDTLGDRRS